MSLRVLDIGGRCQPYRPLFQPDVQRYIALDLIKTEFADVVADAEKLPFSPFTFDLVIATQVFEYLSDPCHTAAQIHDILKPGGALLASFTACTPRFVDEERWRFTPAGLRQITRPFTHVEIVPELSSLGGLVRTVYLGLDTFVRCNIARRLSACPILNLLGLTLEKLKLSSNDQFTTNYSVRALKAGSPLRSPLPH